MKYIHFILLLMLLLSIFSGCVTTEESIQVVATTLPVYEFSSALCAGTDITVGKLVTEELSCLHDYSLQVHQMKMIEDAQVIILSGAGLENFLEDALKSANSIIDASSQIQLHCADHHHEGDHFHESDPHIWLDPEKARQMAQNICDGLCQQYPQYKETILANMKELNLRFDALIQYGKTSLNALSSRNIITFHDGFTYFAEYFDLTILKALEEESGSEASAQDLIELIQMIKQYNLPAIFTEQNGSVSAAQIIARETDVSVYELTMILSGNDYFEQMYKNIDTIKEALQ